MCAKKRILSSLLSASLLVCCSNDDTQTPETVTLVKTVWNLHSFALSGVILPADDGQELSFKLETEDSGEGIVIATADCNQCGGLYTLGAGNSISISLGCTEMYCGDDSQGDLFADALSSVASYDLDNVSLRLIFSNKLMSGTLICEAASD